MTKIDFGLKDSHSWVNQMLSWAHFKGEGMMELLNSYSHVSRGYHGLCHIGFLWYCHNTLWLTESDDKMSGRRIKINNIGIDIVKMDSWTVMKRIAETIASHDKVYDAESKTNEFDSAKWWRKKTFLIDKNKKWVGNASKHQQIILLIIHQRPTMTFCCYGFLVLT